MLNYLRYEISVQHSEYNILKYTINFLLFLLITLPFIVDYQAINQLVVILLVANLPLIALYAASQILHQDAADGSLEFLLTNFSATKIIIVKYLALNLLTIGSFFMVLPLCMLLFQLNIGYLIILSICSLLIITAANALAILIAAINVYFRYNSMALNILIMLFILPSIILVSLILHAPNAGHSSIILTLLGINFITLPIILLLSSYLIENTYHI